MNTQTQDPQTLKHHFTQALEAIPLRSEAEQRALRASLLQTGQLTEPVLLDAEGRVATEHGREMVLAACALGLPQIATRPSDLDAETLLLDDLTQRRVFTKSAIAYLAYPLLQPAFEAAKKRQQASLKKGPNPQCFPVVGCPTTEKETVADFAREKGIERSLLFSAQKVHQIFTQHATRKFTFTKEGGAEDGGVVECTVKEWFAPKLLRAPVGNEHEDGPYKPISLSGVIKGVGYLLSGHNFTGKDRPGRDPEQLDFWTKPMSVLRDDCFAVWDKLGKQKQKLAAELWKRMVAKLPEELADVTIEEIERRRGQKF